MKLLVFAHTPPPHHGQSYMVQLMLEGFGGDQRQRRSRQPALHGIECYHVNARLSKHLEDIGDLRLGKMFLLFGYCLQAIWCRFRYGVENFYYIPAPGKHSALYRDWLVMFLCRPFFKNVILHWHAAGLAKWLETANGIEQTSMQIRSRSITFALMKHIDLSIVLSRYNRADAEKLFPKRIQIISNGIPDPCPAFETEVLPRRQARLHARTKLLAGGALTDAEKKSAGGDADIYRVLYLAHCTREKGVFDAIEGVRLANEKLAAQKSRIRLRLTLAGTFVNPNERKQFDELLSKPELAAMVEYLGFVGGEEKIRILREADLFCFPTFYQNENQPVNLIEAMSFGLPIVTTRWRSLPEMFPQSYSGLVNICAPNEVAEAILSLVSSETGESFRQNFCKNFVLANYLNGLATALHSLEQGEPSKERAFAPSA